MKCPNCDFENREDAHYCGMCGAGLVSHCPACGSANSRTYRFCIRCGTGLPRPSSDVRQPAQKQAASARPTPEPERDAGATTRREAPTLQGERRVATVLLADVKGSTDLLEQLGTETWVEVMNRVLQLLENEIYRFDGKVDQFRGDGLVAFFGTSGAHEDDPERAVLAALSMQQALEQYAEELRELEDIELALRIGINTGEVIVTSVGDDRQYSEDTAMGEAIALAARMETAAAPGTVLVSENTYRLVRHRFEWRPLGEISVKGVSEPVTIYRPLTPRADLERREAYELPSPLVGRDAELDTLKSYVEDLRDGLGGIVTLSGEQGMGKSLLVNELRQYFTRQNVLRAEARDREDDGEAVRVRWIHGRCRSYTQSQPYAMWQDLLHSWLGVRKDEPKEKTRDRLRQETEALWGERAPAYDADLAAFLSLPLAPAFAQQIERLDAEELRHRFFHAIQNWIEALVQQGPLVLSFGDMQWADTTSLDLLKYTLPLCDYTDLLWLFVFRPDRSSPVWEFRHHLETDYPHRLLALTLPALTEEQSQQFITQLIGPDVLPSATQSLIIEKAEGNPYYIQELIRALIAEGVLERDPEDDRWHATQAVTSLRLPDSLQSLLLARIDRLTSDQQQVLQIAAVIGTVFWSNVLEALVPTPERLKAHLTALQRAQLIRERGRMPDLGIEYIFKSPLLRDAAYDSLLRAQRARYHLRVAEHIEHQCCQTEHPPKYISQFYGTLAYHYRHAGRREKELHYTLQGAQQARQVYANAEAEELYTRALKLLDELEAQTEDEARRQALRKQRFEALNERRAVFYLMGKFEAQRADAQALLHLARKLDDDPVWHIDARLQQPGVATYESREEIEAGMPMAQEALALARELDDRHREMECLIAIVNQRLALSDPRWQELAERALELARELNDLHYEARLLIGMGNIYAFSDQPERSMEYLEAAAALAMSQLMEDKIIQMSLLNLLGLEYERSGDYYRLLTEYQQERLHISREIGHRPIESEALHACGRIQALYLGDYAGGLALLEECTQILRGSHKEIYPWFHIVQVQIAQGRHQQAQDNLAHIHTIDGLVQDRGRASLNLIEAMLYNALGDEEHLHEALERTDYVRQLVQENPLISQQYEMAAACKATVAHLKFASLAPTPKAETTHRHRAMEAAEQAHDLYQSFGFAQILECTSEEVLFRYSQALSANHDQGLALKYLRRAYEELTRKHALIPPSSAFRRTYLENIPLHREIRAAYAARVGSILTETEPAHPLSRFNDALRDTSG